MNVAAQSCRNDVEIAAFQMIMRFTIFYELALKKFVHTANQKPA